MSSFAEKFCDLSKGEIYRPEMYVPEPKKVVSATAGNVPVNKHFGSGTYKEDRARFQARREAAQELRKQEAAAVQQATDSVAKSALEGVHGKNLSWQEAHIAGEFKRIYAGKEEQMRKNVGAGYPKGGQDLMRAVREVSRGLSYE